MNEELQKALGALLNKANDGIDAASGFLTAELPDVIQQLLMWHGARSLVLCVIGVVLWATIYKQVKFALSYVKIKPDNKERGHANWCYKYCSYISGYEETDGYVIFRIAIVIASVVEFIMGLALLNLAWLQIWIAPKVWLLEYAASLTK